MPHSTSDSYYTGSNSSPDRTATSSPTSTAPTSRSTTPQLFFPKFHRKPSIPRRPTIKPRKPRPRSGDWNQLLGTTPDHSNTSSARSSLHIAESHADLINRDNIKKSTQPLSMGGNRTSLSMNGALDQKRRTTSYDEQYQYKDNAYGSARERVHRESPVIAELRTNVIVSILLRPGRSTNRR